MSSLLPPLHDGHAPIYLHHAFHEAVDACEDWPLDSAEPVVQVNGKITRISVVFRRLWNCTDTVRAIRWKPSRKSFPPRLFVANGGGTTRHLQKQHA
ncbi:hypothetical protein MKL50_00295 [Brucella abortus]|uniref:hypothetical protein n=1 Tax=Brucella abortus TaxID=235 RepID=UPI0020A544DF|nr:hypothetical protein [Brucella abortus]MCH1764269.1 hypothetical protein [Brucella abortus]